MISNIADSITTPATLCSHSVQEPCVRSQERNTNKSYARSTSPNQLPEPSITSTKRGRSLIDAILDACIKAAPKLRTLSTTFSDSGMPTIETKDGYQVSLSGKQEEWTITDPDGNSTRIWGDPHVEESDGDKWGFKESSSFIFGNNKVTVETTQFSKNPNETLTKTITIYNGQERFSITGIDQNKLELVDWKLDAKAHDESQVDGTAYHLEPTKSEAVNWVKHD